MARNVKELETSYEELKQKVSHYEKNYILPMKVWLCSEFGYGDSQTKGNTGNRIEKVYQKVFENGITTDVRELMEYKKSIQTNFRWLISVIVITLFGVWGNLISNSINQKDALTEKKERQEMVKQIIEELKEDKE